MATALIEPDTRTVVFRRRFHRVLELLHLPDQRRAVRYPCWRPVDYQNIALVSSVSDQAVVVDISRLGLCIFGNYWVSPGTFLSLRFRGLVQPPLPFLVKLVRAQMLESDGCVLGGTWLRPMSVAELNLLVEIPSRS